MDGRIGLESVLLGVVFVGTTIYLWYGWVCSVGSSSSLY